MSSDTTSLGVVNLKSDFRSDLALLDVIEAVTISSHPIPALTNYLLDIMSAGVSDSEK